MKWIVLSVLFVIQTFCAGEDCVSPVAIDPAKTCSVSTGLKYTILKGVEGKLWDVTLIDYAAGVSGFAFIFDGTDCMATKYYEAAATMTASLKSSTVNLAIFSSMLPAEPAKTAFNIKYKTAVAAQDADKLPFKNRECGKELTANEEDVAESGALSKLCAWKIKAGTGNTVTLTLKSLKSGEIWIFDGENCGGKSILHTKVDATTGTYQSKTESMMVLYRSTAGANDLKFSYKKHLPTTAATAIDKITQATTGRTSHISAFTLWWAPASVICVLQSFISVW